MQSHMSSSNMTSRERVIAAIEFRSPDGVPFLNAQFPGALWRHGQALLDLLKDYRDDFGDDNIAIPPCPTNEGTFEEYDDEWGCRWRRIVGWSAGEVIRPPLADWSQWKSYRLPPPSISKHFNEEFRPDLFGAEPLPKDRDWYALYGWFDLCERMQFLRGTPNLLMDLAEDRAEVHELADAIVERNLAMIARYIDRGIDGIFFGDDWGTQNRALINPRLWRTFFKPRYARIFKPLKEAGKHIFFHSCGWTVDFWDDLIELGVDVFNIQHSIMPHDVLTRLRGKVCICSDPGRQHIMPFATPDEVERHVREIVEMFHTPAGGLIQRGEVAPDWPLENVRAMYRVFAECRPRR
jgi:uroporphyrinogen decarboxylase